jgi:hypothetical protein
MLPISTSKYMIIVYDTEQAETDLSTVVVAALQWLDAAINIEWKFSSSTGAVHTAVKAATQYH